MIPGAVETPSSANSNLLQPLDLPSVFQEKECPSFGPTRHCSRHCAFVAPHSPPAAPARNRRPSAPPLGARPATLAVCRALTKVFWPKARDTTEYVSNLQPASKPPPPMHTKQSLPVSLCSFFGKEREKTCSSLKQVRPDTYRSGQYPALSTLIIVGRFFFSPALASSEPVKTTHP